MNQRSDGGLETRTYERERLDDELLLDWYNRAAKIPVTARLNPATNVTASLWGKYGGNNVMAKTLEGIEGMKAKITAYRDKLSIGLLGT